MSKGDHITNDLIQKISDDVMAAMSRTLVLAPNRLAVATAGASAAIGIMSAALQQISTGRKPGSEPDPDAVMLAALIVGRTGAKHPDPIGQAYKDLERLKEPRDD